MKHPTSTPHLSCSNISLFLSAVRKGRSNDARNIDAALVVQQSFPPPICNQDVRESNEARNIDAGLVVQQSFPLPFLQPGSGEKSNEAPKIGAALVVQQSSPFLSAARKGGKQWSAAPFARALRLSCNSISLFFSAVRTWGNSEAPNIDAALVVQQSFPLPFCSQG